MLQKNYQNSTKTKAMNEQNIEKIYDWIEQFNFDELLSEQKEFVLENMSRQEYDDMRSTISDTKNLFANVTIPAEKEKIRPLRKIMTKTLELYKVAASIIVLLGISSFCFKAYYSHNQAEKILIDTVFVTKMDTIIIEKNDTVEIVKEKTVYNDKDEINQDNFSNDNVSFAQTEPLSTLNISQDDIKILSRNKTTGNISKDSSLSNMVMALN